MNINKIKELRKKGLFLAEKYRKTLKNNSNTDSHVWRVVLLSYILITEFNLNLNATKALIIGLIHEFTPGKILSESHSTDKADLKKSLLMFGMPEGSILDTSLYSLWTEYNDQSSVEAIFINSMSGIERLMTLAETPLENLGSKDFYIKDVVSSVESFDLLMNSSFKLRTVLDDIKTDLDAKLLEVGARFIN